MNLTSPEYRIDQRNTRFVRVVDRGGFTRNLSRTRLILGDATTLTHPEKCLHLVHLSRLHQ